MEEINRFVVLAQSGRFSVTDLCEQFRPNRRGLAVFCLLFG
jgi:hypothetical protein